MVMGGIGLILVVIIIVGGVLIGLLLYAISAALWAGKTSPDVDRVEGSNESHAASKRPTHLDVGVDRPSRRVD